MALVPLPLRPKWASYYSLTDLLEKLRVVQRMASTSFTIKGDVILSKDLNDCWHEHVTFDTSFSMLSNVHSYSGEMCKEL